MLYVSVGSPFERRHPDDERFYATIMRPEQGRRWAEDFRIGIRNSMGFDWQPGTGDCWFTDNGRDWLGDNLHAG